MSLADQVTAMILTYNEESNIARTLSALAWVGEVLIVDSGSNDATLAIVGRDPRVRVVERKFDTFADQCNFGLTQVRTPWVLSLDADYELSHELGQEISALRQADDIHGYRARFVYRMFGKPLSATLYPDRTVLYRRERARYCNEGHGHRVMIEGRVEPLRAPIYHDDRKPLARWLSSQLGYASREVDFLLATPRKDLSRYDRLRLMGWPTPILVFLYTLIWKRSLFDGWAGWCYVLQRTCAETVIALEVIDRRLRDHSCK
jgi:glycosyltransferase involved in cell wall biosynthesis